MQSGQPENVLVHRFHVVRQAVEEPLFSDGLHVLVGFPDVLVVVLDGRRHVAGDDLRRVVEEADDGRPVRVEMPPEADIPDGAQRVGDHRHLHGVL